MSRWRNSVTVVVGLIVGVATVLSAAPVVLDGVVRDGANRPLAGARVTLQSLNEYDSTDGNGAFLISATQAADRPMAGRAQKQSVSVRHGVVSFDLDATRDVVISQYSLAGALLARISRRFDAGSHSVDMPGERSVPGLLITEFVADGRAFVVRGNVSPRAAAPRQAGVLAKQGEMPVPAVDTLVVEMNGYVTVKYPVSSLVSTSQITVNQYLVRVHADTAARGSVADSGMVVATHGSPAALAATPAALWAFKAWRCASSAVVVTDTLAQTTTFSASGPGEIVGTFQPSYDTRDIVRRGGCELCKQRSGDQRMDGNAEHRGGPFPGGGSDLS